MSNLKSARAMDGAAGQSPRWQDIRDRLVAVKRPIFDEIRNYPPQVAGCDLHFKALAENRDAVCRELDELDRLRAADDSDLEAFVAASAFLDPGR
ncbi:MAG: hypothetical protein RIB80_18200 [Rhodospirillales bacterium]